MCQKLVILGLAWLGVSGNESGSLANDLAQLRAELSATPADPEEQRRRMEQRKAGAGGAESFGSWENVQCQNWGKNVGQKYGKKPGDERGKMVKTTFCWAKWRMKHMTCLRFCFQVTNW